MATILTISSAVFSKNPVMAGASTKLSVSVSEIVQTPYDQVITSGETTSGEV